MPLGGVLCPHLSPSVTWRLSPLVAETSSSEHGACRCSRSAGKQVGIGHVSVFYTSLISMKNHAIHAAEAGSKMTEYATDHRSTTLTAFSAAAAAAES